MTQPSHPSIPTSGPEFVVSVHPVFQPTGPSHVYHSRLNHWSLVVFAVMITASMAQSFLERSAEFQLRRRNQVLLIDPSPPCAPLRSSCAASGFVTTDRVDFLRILRGLRGRGYGTRTA